MSKSYRDQDRHALQNRSSLRPNGTSPRRRQGPTAAEWAYRTDKGEQ